jgi:alpha-beta hydrolase superfamily lysophospholipase
MGADSQDPHLAHQGPKMRWTQGPVYAGDDNNDIEDRLPPRVALVVAAPQRDEEKEICAAAALPPLPPAATDACLLSLSLSRARALR